MPTLPPFRLLPLLAGLALGAFAGTARAQVPADQAADMLLNGARKAYTEKNYAFARDRFREFLAKFGNHAKARDARFELGLTLLESPERDFASALTTLEPLAGAKDFPRHAYALYYLATSQRGVGLSELAQGRAKPNEMPQRRNNANARFGEAAKQFAGASLAFTANSKEPAADAAELPEEWHWAARARAEQAEMELRLGKIKEALKTAEPFAAKNAPFSKSQSRPFGLYLHGYAAFLNHDYLAAGRSLNQLAAFTEPVFGSHARYLLARVHHLTDEKAEAGGHYEGVLADYAKQKKDAAEALKRPDQFKDKPHEKQRLEALMRDPAPPHVARAAFFAATLAYEAGKFGDALGRFGDFGKQFPNNALQPEVQLRIGYCQVQLKQYAEAAATLKPLADTQPRLADQALLWMGKAQANVFDPNNPATRDNALKTAIATLRQASDKAQQLTSTDPEAKQRKADILFELADTMQAAKQPRDAATVYEQLLNEKPAAPKPEELLVRLAAAYHLAGDYPHSEQVCDRFQKEFGKSPLLPEVLFRSAENAYFAALAAEKEPNLPNRVAELNKRFDEAGKRYKALTEKFPESDRANLARYGLALAHFRKGEFEKAQGVLETIPAPDRGGDLAPVPYLLAECFIRQAPLKAEDALAAGKLQEQLQSAAALLETFIGSAPKGPQAPDAMLKLGHCQQRLAAMLAQPQEKAAAVNAARVTYQKLMEQFPQSPLMPEAVLERAKCIVLAGDKGGAMNELRRFTNDPLQKTPTAAAATIQLATLLREQNKPSEASKTLDEYRKKHEADLAKAPDGAAWVSPVRYHHGVALLEEGKFAEARGLFEQVAAAQKDKPEGAEAVLRAGQCRLLEGRKLIDSGRQKLATPGAKPEEVNAAQKHVADGFNLVREAAAGLERSAEAFKQAMPQAEPRARMLYDAAWAYRLIGEEEVVAARSQMQQEQQKKLQDEATKKTPPGVKPPVVPPPEIARSAVPIQPAEQKARATYTALAAAFADLPLAAAARFELAEMRAEREEHDEAIQALTEALDKEPPADLTERIRLRLGASLVAKKKFADALTQFEMVAQNLKSPLAPQAQYRAGECLLEQNEPAKAAAKFAVFRDKGEFQNVTGVTDRALLRLGMALARDKQWEPSRQALELMLGRFGNSPWAAEARYGVGWANQHQAKYDDAIRAYEQVVAATATELGAKAQLQVGVCRAAQKKYPEAANAFLVVVFNYDYPELNPLALTEAGRCFAEAKQVEQAAKLYQRVVRDYPKSEWAEVAAKRLEALKN